MRGRLVLCHSLYCSRPELSHSRSRRAARPAGLPETERPPFWRALALSWPPRKMRSKKLSRLRRRRRNRAINSWFRSALPGCFLRLVKSRIGDRIGHNSTCYSFCIVIALSSTLALFVSFWRFSPRGLIPLPFGFASRLGKASESVDCSRASRRHLLQRTSHQERDRILPWPSPVVLRLVKSRIGARIGHNSNVFFILYSDRAFIRFGFASRFSLTNASSGTRWEASIPAAHRRASPGLRSRSFAVSGA